jgi:calcium/calmodulin-dependent protein kinase I
MSQNVLVVHGPPQWWVKLADFGLSKRLTESTAYHSKSGGTLPYMAPEIHPSLDNYTSNGDYTNAVDLWAAGCITYRLVTGVVPFPSGRSLWEYCEDKSSFPCDALLDSGIKSSCSEFIKELLESYPKRRLSASKALEHPWITTGRLTNSCLQIFFSFYSSTSIS